MGLQRLSQILKYSILNQIAHWVWKMGKERKNGKPLNNYNNSLATYTQLRDKIK